MRGVNVYQIITEETFEAAHVVTGHRKCGQLHGHSWKLVVCLEAEELPKDRSFDFVQDFGDVKAVLREMVPDHKYLNEVYDFMPTSENLARHFWEELKPAFPELAWVEVWEGQKNRARYFERVIWPGVVRLTEENSRAFPLDIAPTGDGQ
jgi:6-pyruvoyltetrahydropterin/6-carboxytetrahydropterin synthase